MTTFLIVVGALVYVACVIAWVLHRLRRSRRPALILTPGAAATATQGPSSDPESLVIYTRADMNPNLWEQTGQSSFGKPGWRRKKLGSAAPYKIEPMPIVDYGSLSPVQQASVKQAVERRGVTFDPKYKIWGDRIYHKGADGSWQPGKGDDNLSA